MNSYKCAIFVLVVVFLVGVASGQCDSLNMRFVGSWECPTHDLDVYGPDCPGNAHIGKIGNYIIMGSTNFRWNDTLPEAHDSLWIIDASDPFAPEVALSYTDTAFESSPAKIRYFVCEEKSPDSGYIYVGYGGGGREYFRVLKFKANPPTVAPMGIVDSASYIWDATLMGCWVYASTAFYVANPETPLRGTVVHINEGYQFPPDGDESESDCGRVHSSENYWALTATILSVSFIAAQFA